MESSAMPMIPECLLLYLVTDAPEHCSLGLAETVRRAIAGGVTLVQYRREHVDAATMLREAAELREITRAAGVPFIVNNDVRLALQVGADGVHLGQSDMPVAQARKLAGQGFIIGVSVSNEREMLAVDPHVADYVGCGPVFPTGHQGRCRTRCRFGGLGASLAHLSVAHRGHRRYHRNPCMRAARCRAV